MAGAVAGFLLAPRKREETRRVLSSYARKAGEKVLGKAEEVRAAFDETIERDKCFIGENVEDVEAATSIGRKSLRERRDTRCK